MCIAAAPSATGSAAFQTVSNHAANSWRCHQLSHLLCHLLRRGAVQELAHARVEQVVLEPRCVQPSERPLVAQAAVLHSCLTILLRLLPLKLCLYLAALDPPATPPPLPTH